MSKRHPREADTVARRLQKYKRFQKLDAYLGGALGGLVLFGDLAKDAFFAAPAWVGGAFITFAIFTGLLIGSAYSGFEWAQTTLERKLEDNGGTRRDRIADLAPDSWPSGAHLCQNFAPIFIGITAFWLLVAAWWKDADVRRWTVQATGSFLWVAILVVAMCAIAWFLRRSNRRAGDGAEWIDSYPPAKTITEKRAHAVLVATNRAKQIATETFTHLGPQFDVVSQSLSEPALFDDASAMIVMRGSDDSIISVHLWDGGSRVTINRSTPT